MSDIHAVSRRPALKGTAVLAAATIVGEFARANEKTALANGISGESDSDVRDGSQYGFLVRAENCVNCRKCVDACRRHNGTPDDLEARRTVTAYESDFGKRLYVSTSCMHCAAPSCADVCPARAIAKRPDGIVVVDKGLCIGCKYCFQACPFGVPHYGGDGMDKCDCCLEAGVPAGEKPNCVNACLFGALEYGLVDALEAATGKTARRVVAQTGPSYFLA